MALVKAAILPHSPLLIPEIGRANHTFLNKTSQAYEQVKDFLKSLEVDTLVIVSPHGPSASEAYTINVSPEMEINFQDFGFIPPKTNFTGDSLLADKIKNDLRNKFAVQLVSENVLDYGSAIPVYLLKNEERSFKIITITPPENLDLENNYRFGKELQAIIKASNKNIAVISSSDLSHRLKKNSPGGYSPKGAKFDNKLIEYLNDPETAALNILKIDNKLINEAGECGLKPIMLLLGLLENTVTEAKTLAYQTDFGVGYLSLDFKIDPTYE